MALLKRVKIDVTCPDCGKKYTNYVGKPHECFPAKDREEDPENRPEMQHQADLKAAQFRRSRRSRDDEPER
jgi:hypothetical protein